MSEQFNEPLAREWIAALRSGNYKRADGWLCKQNEEKSFCALGVLADVALKRGDLQGSWNVMEMQRGINRTVLVLDNDPDFPSECNGTYLQTLPVSFMQKLRMSSNGDFDFVQYCVEQIEPDHSVIVSYGCVTEANDRGLEFETIATMIHHYLFPEESGKARINKILPYEQKERKNDVEHIPF